MHTAKLQSTFQMHVVHTPAVADATSHTSQSPSSTFARSQSPSSAHSAKRIKFETKGVEASMRVHAVSDLHADYAQNLQWCSIDPSRHPLPSPLHSPSLPFHIQRWLLSRRRCEGLSDTAYRDDAVIIAGDVCDSLTTMEQVQRSCTKALSCLTPARFSSLPLLECRPRS